MNENALFNELLKDGQFHWVDNQKTRSSGPWVRCSSHHKSEEEHSTQDSDGQSIRSRKGKWKVKYTKNSNKRQCSPSSLSENESFLENSGDWTDSDQQTVMSRSSYPKFTVKEINIEREMTILMKEVLSTSILMSTGSNLIRYGSGVSLGT